MTEGPGSYSPYGQAPPYVVQMPKELFIGLVCIYALIEFFLVVRIVQVGHPFVAVFFGLLASIIPIALLREFTEPGSVADALRDFHELSWAMLFGDGITLMFSFFMAAIAWRSMPDDSWFRSSWWLLLSMLIGAGAAYVFRFLNDKPTYYAAHAVGSFNAPTKLYHDFGAYFILFGGLWCVGIPLLFHLFGHNHVSWLAFLGMVLGIVIWGVLGWAHDTPSDAPDWMPLWVEDLGFFSGGLDPLVLHPNNVVWLTWRELFGLAA